MNIYYIYRLYISYIFVLIYVISMHKPDYTYMIAYGLAILRMHTNVHFPDSSGPTPRTGKELAVKLERVDSKHPMLLYEAGFTSSDGSREVLQHL